MKVLAVDDESVILTLEEKYLSASEFEVKTANEAQEAIAISQREAFDAILLDIMMPGTNGFDICRALRAEGPNKRTPVIFVTARTDSLGLASGFKSGGTVYLNKPFTRRQLLSAVSAVLAKEGPQPQDAHSTQQPRVPEDSPFRLPYTKVMQRLSLLEKPEH